VGVLGASSPSSALPSESSSSGSLIRTSRSQEEHPPIISNVGMGSIIVNYYRKKAADDPFIPSVRPPLSLSLPARTSLPSGRP